LGLAISFWHGQYFPLFLGIGTLTIILAAGKFNFSREWFAVGRVLGNSLETRADIQYAMSLSRGLAMGGSRTQNLDTLAEDVVFIARKLGFASVRIRLEDAEKVWPVTDAPPQDCDFHRHGLPGHKYCFLEFGVARHGSKRSPDVRITTDSASDILADLVAEGWAKAIKDWKKYNELPVRFDARRQVLPTVKLELLKASQPTADSLPLR
jgi:hypothetical protein